MNVTRVRHGLSLIAVVLLLATPTRTHPAGWNPLEALGAVGEGVAICGSVAAVLAKAAGAETSGILASGAVAGLACGTLAKELEARRIEALANENRLHEQTLAQLDNNAALRSANRKLELELADMKAREDRLPRLIATNVEQAAQLAGQIEVDRQVVRSLLDEVEIHLEELRVLSSEKPLDRSARSTVNETIRLLKKRQSDLEKHLGGAG